jgi:guanylate kinase
MLVLSSPSGAGKTTLSRLLLESDKAIDLSVSVTTRERRPGEVSGRHYHFIDKPRFKEMVRNKELLEWAEVFGNYYGTPRAPVERALASGKDVLFDIDWQGANQLKRKVGKDLVTVFVLPPSVPELHKRLRRRAQDSEQVIRRRMAEAGKEMSHWDEYDYVIVNYDLEKAFADLRTILAAERMKRARQSGLAGFVEAMQKKL